MSKFKIINLFDKVFVSIAIFLTCYAWINFYIRNLWSTFILSLILSFAIVFLLYHFLDKKQAKNQTKKKTIENTNTYYLAFRLLSNEKKLDLINTILSKKYKTERHEKYLILTQDNKKNIVVLATNFEKITENDLFNILSEYNDIDFDEINIICNQFLPNINTKIFNNKKINLIDKNKLYSDYFEDSKIYPNIENLDKHITKFNWRNLIKNFFLPNKAKSYFFCGLILIFSSIILPYHVYYIIFGSVLMIFSIVCKILPKLQQK